MCSILCSTHYSQIGNMPTNGTCRRKAMVFPNITHQHSSWPPRWVMNEVWDEAVKYTMYINSIVQCKNLCKTLLHSTFANVSLPSIVYNKWLIPFDMLFSSPWQLACHIYKYVRMPQGPLKILQGKSTINIKGMYTSIINQMLSYFCFLHFIHSSHNQTSLTHNTPTYKLNIAII